MSPMICTLCNRIPGEVIKETFFQEQLNFINDLCKSLSIQCTANHEYKIRQIDENKKFMKEIEDIKERLLIMENRMNNPVNFNNLKEVIRELAKSADARFTGIEDKIDKKMDKIDKVSFGILGCTEL